MEMAMAMAMAKSSKSDVEFFAFWDLVVDFYDCI
jgi:hypothetical protein